MKYLLIVIAIGLILMSLSFPSRSTLQNVHPSTTQTGSKAEEIWELAINAKGGRDRLQSITNMVVSSSTRMSHERKVSDTHNESLYVFDDNRSWTWDDLRPSVFGLTIAMHDGKTGKQYNVTYGGAPFRGLVDINPPSKNTNGAGLIHYFLETKWNKPIPESVTRGKVGSKAVDIVRTSFLDEQVDFAFDVHSHLLLRVVFYSGGIPKNRIRMSDYVAVSGVQMPTQGTLEQSDGEVKYNVRVSLNVDFDETIFTTPPPFDRGPEVWRRRQ